MHTVGLTGGIGSGKSLVANIFKHIGIPVFDADSESKNILDHDLQVRQKLIEWFGTEVIKSGKPDHQKIAGIIFSNQESLAKMNGLLHPLVRARFISWCGKNQKQPYVIHEAAILFESGIYRQMNATILVTAPEKIRIARVRQRDKTTEESILQRMHNQWTDERKSPLANFVINNDGESPLLPRILEIHNKLIDNILWQNSENG